jgi:prefoldin subunit 5
MPLAADNNLDELYALHRMLQHEADSLEREHHDLDADAGRNRRYILEIEIEALREEATRLSAAISDILERDLQR